MRVLVIDTALGLCTAAVVDVSVDPASDLHIRGCRSEPMTKGHQERLAGFARDAVAQTIGGFAAIDRIGVTVGPGSFTGLRVGMAFAQGLGAALDRPVVGLSCLDALALAGRSDAGQEGSTGSPVSVGAVIDARRGQVYARFWRSGQVDGPAEALSVQDAVSRAADLGSGLTLVGSGARLLADHLTDVQIVDALGPLPSSLARMTAQADILKDRPRPLYLRAPDAIAPTRLPGQARTSAIKA